MSRPIMQRFQWLRILSAVALIFLSVPVPAEVALKRPGHPRLTMTPAELQKLQADPAAVRAASEAGEKMLGKTKTVSYTDCFAVLPAPTMPAPHPYNKKWPYWTGICSEIRGYLETTARGWAIGRNRKCLEAARSTMLAVARWTQWTDLDYGEAPCLDTYSLTRGMSTAYDLLFHDLKPRERRIVRRAIVDKGLRFIYSWGFNPASYVMKPALWPNGFAVINTAMGVGGMALLDEIPDAARYITESLAKMDLFFREVAGADGGLIEGFGYGSFAIDNFVDLILQAHDVCGIDAMTGEYLKHAGEFPIYFTLPGGGKNCLPAIGDNGNINGCAPTLGGLMQALVKLKNDAKAAWYLNKAELAGDEAAKIARAPGDWPLGRRFPSIEWAALRDNWGDSGALMAFKSGFAEHHNHLDQNHFLIGWDKEWIITDPGYQIYDMDYPPERKMDRKAIRNMHVYTAKSEGHNTILVDGSGQNGRKGSIAEFFASSVMGWVVGDAAACYDEKLSRFRRSVLHMPGEYFLVYDDIVAKNQARIEFTLHTAPDGQFIVSGQSMPLAAQSDARTFVILRPSGQVTVDLISPLKTTLEHRQWPDSQNYGHYVTITAEPATSHENAFILRPGPAGKEAAPLVARLNALEGRVRIVTIGSDRLLINPDGLKISVDGFTTDARAAVYSERGGSLRYGIVDGTSFSLKEPLMSGTAPFSAGIRVNESDGGTAMEAEIETKTETTVSLTIPDPQRNVIFEGEKKPGASIPGATAKTIRLELKPGRHVLKLKG